MTSETIFSLIAKAESLAEKAEADETLSADDRKVAKNIRAAMKTWKVPAFRFKDYAGRFERNLPRDS